MELDPRAKARLIRWSLIIGVLLLLWFIGTVFLRLNADYLWYRYDAEATVVFWTQVRTRLLMFLIGLAVAVPLLIWNARVALTASTIARRRPDGIVDSVVENLLGVVQRIKPILWRVVWIGGPVLGVLFGLSFAAKWSDALLFFNAVQFGKSDSVFHNDYSFYVFRLPMLVGLVSWALALWFVCALVAALIYFGIGSVAALGKRPFESPVPRKHLSILAAIGFILVGLSVYFGRYDLLTATTEKFAGPGYAEMQGLGARTLTAWLLWISAGVSILNARLWPPLAATMGCVAVCFLVYVVGVVLWPGFVQAYRVNPNEVTLQTPYISRAIAATRWAYGLDQAIVKPVDAQVRPSEEAIRASESTLINMRLWDTEILQENVQKFQSLRAYFNFPDIDVDRYMIGGKQRMLMLGARELTASGLEADRRSWQNLHLQYTHGIGVVAVPVNETQADGMPVYFLKDVPPQGRPELQVDEPRIYFGDTTDATNLPEDRYVLVRTKLPEFDYSTQGETEHRWTGKRGIAIGSTWGRMLFSVVLRDSDILFSRDLTEETRLLWRRNIRVRAAHILPFMQWDRDPYITIIDGRLLWIMDGYTTTDSIPYSQPSLAGAVKLNYIRNSVKLTIDAYTGDWHAYVTDPADPIIRAYQRIYPGLLKQLSEAPEEVKQHFRYPEDLFTIQCHQLARYHVTDALTFFRGEDQWQIPNETGAGSEGRPIRPYYVQMRLPDEKRDAFLIIMPFSPVGRPNMIGWLAAHCDQAHYGKLSLYTFPIDRNINGPEQQESQFETEPELSARRTLLGQGGSKIIPGNLVVVPIGESVMYVKTLFLQADRPGIKAIPQLRIVVLAFSDDIVFADTYEQALSMLVGSAGRQPGHSPAGETATAPTTTADFANQTILRDALAALREADEALKAGDWAKYGEAQKRARRLLEEVVGDGRED